MSGGLLPDARRWEQGRDPLRPSWHRPIGHLRPSRARGRVSSLPGEITFTILREALVGGELGEGMSLDDYVQAIGLPSGWWPNFSVGQGLGRSDS